MPSPFSRFAEVEPESVQEEWDAYWTSKTNPSALVYDLIATFYRKRIINRCLIHFIKKHFRAHAQMLHAGCGCGQVDVDIADRVAISALDISRRALSLYRKFQPRTAQIIHGSILRMPVQDFFFDGVYNLGVMEHFTPGEIHQILREFNRVLKPGGKILLFWPPAFGLTVCFLAAVRWVLHKLGKTEVKLHPDEITYVRSRRQIRLYLEDSGFTLIDYYFGPRDLFTHTVIVGEKVATDHEGQTIQACSGADRKLSTSFSIDAG